MNKCYSAKEPRGGIVLVFGAGNVGQVAIHKMAQRPDVFTEIHVVTRTKESAERIRDSVYRKNSGKSLHLHNADASNKNAVASLIGKVRPDLVVNLAPPYWNLILMEACLEACVHYLDTACYEDPNKLGFSNKPQLAMHQAFKKKGLMAQLQCGFDPGATNLFVAYALQEQLFDRIDSVDILDCNAGKKNVKWAPNFDPEINIRELILEIKSVLNGRWQTHGRLIDNDAIRFSFDFPEAGKQDAYLMYHEELESLKRLGINRLRFWMTFSEDYLTHLRIVHDLGLTRIDPVEYREDPESPLCQITPVRFLRSLLPKGEDFNESYRGKTNIGCIIQGMNHGRQKTIYIYQVCSHQKAFQETGGNAIGYTTAVPAVVGAMMMLTGTWSEPGVLVPEARPAKPFLKEMAKSGLPWRIKVLPDLPEFLKQNFKGKNAYTQPPAETKA